MCLMTALKKVTRISFRRDSERGERGERGAVPRLRKFVIDVEYQCGADGEDFLDYAYYDGLWYKCLITHTPTGDQNPFDEIGHGYDTWEVESNFSFLATECAIVGSDGNGWVLSEGEITHTSGKVSLKSDGSANFNDKCIITADGEITAKSGTFSGFLVATIKERSGSITLSNEENILSGGYLTLTLPTSVSFVGRRVLVIDDNFPPYTKTSLGFYTYIKVASGNLYGLGEYADTSTPAYQQIEIRGGAVELLALPFSDTAVRWIVVAGHENIISKS